MWVYIVRRMVWLPFLLFATSLMVFTLARIAPGDPVVAILGGRYDPVVAERLRESMGLDKPAIVQYVDYMRGAVHLDFGESYRFRGRPVGELLAPKIWVSFQVSLVGMISSVLVALPLGFWAARKQGTWVDPAVVSISLLLMSIPIMVTIPVLLWVFCQKLHWLPCSGWGGLFDSRMLYIVIGGAIFGVAGLLRLMRASTLDVMGQDFIRTARSKGLAERVINYRHVMRNALIPIVTVLSLSLSGLLSTSFILERILGIPGVGNFAIDSVFNRDYPVLMATGLIGSTAMVVSVLISDIAYAFVDPRIRYR
jgi:ABC-type dipeptide/oligopeptide/nickel transport system permease component